MEDDIEPGVVLRRSFLRLTKGIGDFKNRIITIDLNLDPFNDVESDKADDLEDDWVDILEGIDFGDIPKIKGLELPRYKITCSCFLGFIDKDLINLVIPDVRRYVVVLTGPRLSMQDLYDMMGNMEIRHEMLGRMARKQLYHTDRYAGMFEHMVGHYGYTLQGEYALPGYDEEQQNDEE
nr:hypothetical protein [Tanacetum cinerariifolium]